MNHGRADPARMSILALAAVAILLALVIPYLSDSQLDNRSTTSTVAAVSDRRADVAPPFRAARAGLKPGATPRLMESYGRLPLSFEANRGQTDSQVKFLSRGSGYTMFLTQSEAVLSLKKPSAVSHQPAALRKGMASAMPLGGPASSRALAPEGPLSRAPDALFPPLIQNPKSQIQNPPAPSPQHPAPCVSGW